MKKQNTIENRKMWSTTAAQNKEHIIKELVRSREVEVHHDLMSIAKHARQLSALATQYREGVVLG
jgi:hypothetical protein